MVKYVVADPTKNITVLVTEEVPKEARAEVTKAIFAAEPSCEQVGYLTEPELGGFATDRIEMMGGEFCGNATLALAAYVARRDGITETCDVDVECSGVDKVITCRIKPLGKAGREETSALGEAAGAATATAAGAAAAAGATAASRAAVAVGTAGEHYRYEGTLEMPVPDKIEYCDSHPVVFLPGIAHMIMPADRFTRRQVENNIRDYAARYDAAAFGILLWDEDAKAMNPCVYVKNCDTVVWENGCATGSTCIGWYRYKELGEKTTEVSQPGGVIKVEVQGGRPYMTGKVEI